MDAVLSEERQFMKWVRIFQMGIFWVGIFQGGFNRWEFSGGEGSFPAGIFLEPVKKQFLMFS